MKTIAGEGTHGATAASARWVIERITAGLFKPGHRLAEQWLADETKVSRAVARQALILLEAQNWVESIRHRGMVVKRFSRDEATDLSVLLGLNLGLAARRAWRPQTMARSTALRDAYAAVQLRSAESNIPARQFCYTLVDLAGSRALAKALELPIYACTEFFTPTTQLRSLTMALTNEIYLGTYITAQAAAAEYPVKALGCPAQ